MFVTEELRKLSPKFGLIVPTPPSAFNFNFLQLDHNQSELPPASLQELASHVARVLLGATK